MEKSIYQFKLFLNYYFFLTEREERHKRKNIYSIIINKY